jgi:hypothetical protein
LGVCRDASSLTQENFLLEKLNEEMLGRFTHPIPQLRIIIIIVIIISLYYDVTVMKALTISSIFISLSGEEINCEM